VVASNFVEYAAGKGYTNDWTKSSHDDEYNKCCFFCVSKDTNDVVSDPVLEARND
jgi:hypothetical protein